MSLEKYSGTKAQTSKVIEYDSDPYSTSIVEDLLAVHKPLFFQSTKIIELS